MDNGILFTNGSVFVDGGFAPRGTSVLVTGDRIAAVGTEVDPGRAEVVDLDGGTLLPGFIDAHAHPVFGGMQLLGCDLSGADDAAGYLAILDRYARAHPELAWITGGGWSMAAFPGGIPTRQALDAVVSDRPVLLDNRDGHGAWANSRALELAGITRDTTDPSDGRIERDDRGDPIGMLQEGAMRLVKRLLPPVTDEDRYQGLLAGQDYLLSLGVTGWQDAIVGRGFGQDDATSAYRQAVAAGTLRANVVGALWWRRDQGLEQLDELLHRRDADAAGRFRPTSVKMMLDGVAENHTAALLDPYLDGHGCATENAGLDFIDPDELPRFVTELDARGFQVHFHALGDRAVRNALNAVEAARKANPGSAARHHLAHLQVVHPDDVPRFAALGATANIQPLWATNEAQMIELTIPFLGEVRSTWQYPFAALAAAGAHIAGGSDWPVSSPDPLLGIHVAVNRSTPDNATRPFLPEQAISLRAALAAYTAGSARVNGLENTAGSITAGRDADLAVVDADLADIRDHEICQAAVRQTWVRGELAYDRKENR
ncbi:MAG TPA: amidohydrolase family protein [Trebonia sp.]|nr:amidohydrolase family protein [Trebonia sp.]